jgi:uncharacterized protein (DUF1015 family)
MGDIAPLRGYRYNQEVVPDLAAVVTPPYDVISPAAQEIYYRRHPYNMVRLILENREPGDTEEHNWFTRAAEELRAWREQRILLRDPQPALYDYEIDYSELPGLTKTRQGFICLVRLQEFSHGSIRPHERTFAATKSERLKLMCACNANLSQIFALYPDPADVVRGQLRVGREERPVMAFADEAGIRHRLWRVTAPEVIKGVAALMEEKPLFLADGHHRYETALAYRELMRAKYHDRGEKASFNYVLMYLASMNQDGLTILPTHRLFGRLPEFQLDSFLEAAGRYFEVEPFPFDSARREQVLESFLASLRGAGSRHFVGLYTAEAGAFVLLKLRADVDSRAWRDHLPGPLHHLDVVVLTELVLKRLLRVDEKTLGDERQIHYSHDGREAVRLVDSGAYQVAFLINPTRVDQVQEVASAGLIMPHKSTYFYPKVIDGSVLHLLDPHEDVSL